MTSSIILNESPLIKDRLRDAYNTIILISDNDFAEDSSYKRTHQVLHAIIKKLEDDTHFESPKFVEDVIPYSNLAKYGHYQYNESRERSYTPCVHPSPSQYPPPTLLCKADMAREPWMLPEVEQLFIHTAFASSYNFTLYESELEKLDKLDAFADEAFHGMFPFCWMGDLHKPSTSSTDQMFEKTTNDQQEQQSKVRDLPFYFTNVAEHDGKLLRKRILSEQVRNLWDKPILGSKDRLFEVYKSVLDNILFHDEEYQHVNTLKPDDTTLKNLVDSIVSLNDKLPNANEDQLVSNESKLSESQSSEPSEQTPQRRLYSDVVQGNKQAIKSSSKSHQEPTSPKSEAFSDDSSNINKSSSVLLHSESLTNSSTVFLDPLQIDAPSASSTNFESPETINNNANGSPPPSSRASSSKCSYSEAVNNNSNGGYPSINQFNMPFINSNAEVPMYDNNRNYQNVFNPAVHFISNAMFPPNNYRMSYPNGNPYAGNQQAPMNRNPGVRPPPWFVAPYRPAPAPYNVLLLPQLPTKHRWTNQHYVRPTTTTPPPSMFNPGTSQPSPPPPSAAINRSNSNQQVNCYVYDGTPKSKKKAAVPNSKFTRSKTPDSVPVSKNKTFACKKASTTTSATITNTGVSSSNKILAKPNSDYRLMARGDGESPSATSNESMIPISCCASDELEKIALREYQSSHEMFFSEIERQAEEQYDGNPENCFRPPNRRTTRRFLGGLQLHSSHTFYSILHLYLFMNTS